MKNDQIDLINLLSQKIKRVFLVLFRCTLYRLPTLISFGELEVEFVELSSSSSKFETTVGFVGKAEDTAKLFITKLKQKIDKRDAYE